MIIYKLPQSKIGAILFYISELKGWKAEISNTLFNVNAIPRAILIDENENFEDLDFKINSVH